MRTASSSTGTTFTTTDAIRFDVRTGGPGLRPDAAARRATARPPRAVGRAVRGRRRPAPSRRPSGRRVARPWSPSPGAGASGLPAPSAPGVRRPSTRSGAARRRRPPPRPPSPTPEPTPTPAPDVRPGGAPSTSSGVTSPATGRSPSTVEVWFRPGAQARRSAAPRAVRARQRRRPRSCPASRRPWRSRTRRTPSPAPSPARPPLPPDRRPARAAPRATLRSGYPAPVSDVARPRHPVRAGRAVDPHPRGARPAGRARGRDRAAGRRAALPGARHGHRVACRRR